MEHIWDMHVRTFKADIHIPCLKLLQGNEFCKINICSMALLLIYYELNVSAQPPTLPYPNSYVEVLISNMVAFGGETFGEKLGLEEVIKEGSLCLN